MLCGGGGLSAARLEVSKNFKGQPTALAEKLNTSIML